MNPPSSIAHYRVVCKLGEGGMGVVYEAIDGHLERHVALKILPGEKVAATSRKQRFIQEARAASALNHPNIVTIYDINSADGVEFIAMELIHGRTLEELLRGRRLKVTEALKYAVQIADALGAAHAAGIVHRDVKPANVMVTESGLVKVLDFGLAKLTDQSEVTEEDATRTEPAVTDEGTVLGSAPYMSPEQAEGKKVDARSDIFSFGVVLYEMLTGKRAFRGETRMATMAAVLNTEPAPLAELAPGLPKELERIVGRCLRKDLSRRSQSIAEIKLALEELKEESESGPSASAVPGRKPLGLRRWIAIGVAVAAAAAGLWFLVQRGGERRAALQEVPLTSFAGFHGQAAISQDGNQFAFVWDGGQDGAPMQLYVSLVGRGTPLRLTNVAGAEALWPTWSPDGQTIAFVRRIHTPGQLILIPALGGAERRVVGEMTGRAAWSSDGKWLYYCGSVASERFGIFVAPAAGGEGRKLIEPLAQPYGDIEPTVSPDGRHLVFVREYTNWNSDLFLCDLKDGTACGGLRQITTDRQYKRAPAWTADGRDILYIKGEASGIQGTYRVSADGGTPSHVDGISEYATSLSIAPKSGRLIYSRSVRDTNIWRMPLGTAGGPAGTAAQFLSSTRYETSAFYSPDGKRIAFTSNRGGLRQIWVADADGSNPVVLTNFTEGVTGSSRWSPDSQTLVLDARPEGLADVYTVRADGGPVKRLTDHRGENHVPCYSVDGRWIYFASSRSGQRQIYRMPAGGGDFAQVTHNGGFVPVASPDGKWLYYSKAGGGVWRMPIDGGEETQALPDGSLFNVFAYDVTKSGLYFVGPRDLESGMWPLKLRRFTDGKTVELARLNKSVGLHLSVSPDEKWLLYSQLDTSVDDVRLVENFR